MWLLLKLLIENVTLDIAMPMEHILFLYQYTMHLLLFIFGSCYWRM
jgi:hypothetical protein